MTGTVERLLTEHLDTWTAAVETKSAAGRGSSKKLKLVGIAKLRELILELAVRGQLVPQDESDEPASVLLERIAAERERLVQEKKIKKQKALSEISENEKQFHLPENWSFARLSEVIQISSGNGLTASKMHKEGKIPVYGGNGVTGYHNKSNVVKPTLAIGRVGFYCGSIHITPEIAWVTDNAFITTFSESNIDLNFLYWLLKATNLSENDSATAQPVISGRKVYPIVVGIPPLTEQLRIVSKVDELMALCDALEQEQESSIAAHGLLVENLLAALTNAAGQGEFKKAWARVAAHFDTLFTTEQSVEQLKQAILQLAVMGKLVEQDPADEPAGVLLERISAEKTRLVAFEKLRTKAQDSIGELEHYIPKPEGWEYLRLGNLARFIDYRGKTPKKIDSGIPLITAKNIKFGYISKDPAEFISKEDYKTWMTRGFPKVGDVLFTTEAPLGNIALIDINYQFALAQRAICFQMHVPEVARFLVYLFMSEIFRVQLDNNATGMTAKGIKSSKLKEIPILLPPLEEQKRIVSKMEELMTVCEKLKFLISESLQTEVKLAENLTRHSV